MDLTDIFINIFIILFLLFVNGFFVAAEFSRLGIKMPAPHTGAEVAGRLVRAVGNRENIGLENRHGNLQKLCIALDFAAVAFIVARVHDEKDKVKRHFAVPL